MQHHLLWRNGSNCQRCETELTTHQLTLLNNRWQKRSFFEIIKLFILYFVQFNQQQNRQIEKDIVAKTITVYIFSSVLVI